MINYFNLIRNSILLTLLCSSICHANYSESLSAEDKLNYLWSQIKETNYISKSDDQLPKLKKFGFKQLVRMGFQRVTQKVKHKSDFASKGWKKYIHARGVVAPVEIRPVQGNNYTGVISGAKHALLRLSVTFRPSERKGRGFAPGLALKVLRDGAHSVNVSALYKLSGQGLNYNFFEYALSNIVPNLSLRSLNMGVNMVHNIFAEETKYPEELLINEMTNSDVKGKAISSPSVLRQVFFVPNHNAFKFTNAKHDFRDDFLSIGRAANKNVKLYDIYAAPQRYLKYDYLRKYKEKHIEGLLKEAMSDPKNHIAEIYLKEGYGFVASSFGDDQLFFRHEVRAK